MKNNILAVLGGTVALFGLGYLIYEVIFGGATFGNGSGAEAAAVDLDIKIIILMEVLYAVLLVMIFNKRESENTFSTGIKPGFIIGAFIGASLGLYLLATTSIINVNGVLFAAATFAVRFAVAGGVVAYFLGKE